MTGCAGAPLLRGHQCTKRYPRAPTQQLAAIYSERHTQNKEISMTRAVLIDRLIGFQLAHVVQACQRRPLFANQPVYQYGAGH